MSDYLKSPYTFILTGYAILIGLAISGCGAPFKGEPGVAGRDSEPCTVGKTGTVTTVTCPDGTEAEIPDPVNGTDGTDGATGAMGPAGQNAAPCVPTSVVGGVEIDCPGSPIQTVLNGTDATPVTAVQFCTGYTTTYPSVFAEYGLCVSGNLYGVYWDGHNSWLSALPPGYYASTSTSAPCNFTIGTGCAVSQ